MRGGAVSSCRMEQDVYFHTRVVDPKSVLVIELVAIGESLLLCRPVHPQSFQEKFKGAADTKTQFVIRNR